MPVDSLFARMGEDLGKPAILGDSERVTYGSLLDHVSNWDTRLKEAGVARGAIVGMTGEYSAESVSLFLALLRVGAVAVIVGGTDTQNDENLQVAEAQWFASASMAKGWSIEPRAPGPPINPVTIDFLGKARPGLVIFSSGSTGRPKGSLFDCLALLSRYTPRPPIRMLSFLLLDHIGGINTLFYTLTSGGSVVTTQSRDPSEVCRIMAEHKVELLPVSPTFLKMMLISGAHTRHDLSSLRMITYGTEVMPESVLLQLRAALPNVELKQMYGTTELGILRSQSRESGSVWVRLGGEGYETKVLDGILWVRSKTSMIGYLNAPYPFDSEGWMNTHDRVEVDGEYLRVLGRESNLINVGGEKVYPAAVESVLLTMPNVVDATVVGRSNPLTGKIVSARLTLVDHEEPSALLKRVREFCAGKLSAFQIPMHVEVVGQQPVSLRFKKIRDTTS